MTSTVLGPMLVVTCLVMSALGALIYAVARLGPAWVVPAATLRAAAQLAAVAAVLTVALSRLWSSVLVLVAMFGVAAVTSARRSAADRGAAWLAMALGAGLATVIPLLLATGLLPLTGVALVPTTGIILGGTMTAVTIAARRGLDALSARRGELEAALSLGVSERDSRLLVMNSGPAEALIPNVDQARTAGLVSLPGAFVGVLLSTGSAAQAGAVQVLVLVGLLLAQSAGVALTAELIARGRITRAAR